MPFFLSHKITAQITALHVMEYLPLVYIESQRTLDAIFSKHLEESKNILNKSREIGNKNSMRVETELRKGDAASNY
jgi:hypothetical protein